MIFKSGRWLGPCFGKQPHPASTLCPCEDSRLSQTCAEPQHTDDSDSGLLVGTTVSWAPDTSGGALRLTRCYDPDRWHPRLWLPYAIVQQCRHRQHQPVTRSPCSDSVLRVFCHCQPRLLSALKPISIQNRSMRTSTHSGIIRFARSVITSHGSSCPHPPTPQSSFPDDAWRCP